MADQIPGRRLNELPFPVDPTGAEVYGEKNGVSVRLKVGEHIPSGPGGGGGPTNASNVSVADAGGYFAGSSVEDALQEIGAKLASAGDPDGLATLDGAGRLLDGQQPEVIDGGNF